MKRVAVETHLRCAPVSVCWVSDAGGSKINYHVSFSIFYYLFLYLFPFFSLMFPSMILIIRFLGFLLHPNYVLRIKLNFFMDSLITQKTCRLNVFFNAKLFPFDIKQILLIHDFSVLALKGSRRSPFTFELKGIGVTIPFYFLSKTII